MFSNISEEDALQVISTWCETAIDEDVPIQRRPNDGNAIKVIFAALTGVDPFNDVSVYQWSQIQLVLNILPQEVKDGMADIITKWKLSAFTDPDKIHTKASVSLAAAPTQSATQAESGPYHTPPTPLKLP